MSKKKSLITRRAWSLLRLALLWGRKGGIFQKVMRKLVHSDRSKGGLIYGDHEFSFGDTPIVHVKMHRPSSTLSFKMPHIPCINPQVLDFEDDDLMWCDHLESTCILDDEEEIDVKAELFIANFYAQMKLQTQLTQ